MSDVIKVKANTLVLLYWITKLVALFNLDYWILLPNLSRDCFMLRLYLKVE